MSNFLRNLDCFGSHFNFRIQNESSFKTILGGILTIIFTGIVVFLSFIFCKDFFNRSNPNLFNLIYTPKDYPNLILNNENLLIAWRIEDENQEETQFEGNIYPIFEYFSYSKNSTSENKDLISYRVINHTKCDKITAKVPEFYNNFKASKWYCLDWNNFKESLGGYWDASFTNYFRLEIRFCSVEGNCLNYENIKNYFKTQKYISFMIPHNNIDPLENIKDPVKIYYKNYFYGLSLSMAKLDRIFFRSNILNDNIGLLYDKLMEYSHIGFQEMVSDIYNINFDQDWNNKKKYLYKGVFYFQKQSTIFIRTYVKFLDVAARLSVIIKVLYIIVGILYSPINEYFKNNHLYNKLFELVNKIDNNRELKSKKLEILSDRNKEDNILDNIPIKKDGAINKDQIIDALNSKKINSMKFGLLNIIISKSCPGLIGNDKKNIMIAYHRISDYYNKRIDIVYYMKFIEKFEILKNILLSKEQSISFNFLKRPNITDKSEMNMINVDILKDNYEDAMNVVNYFNEKFKSNNIISKDLLIYTCLDESLKKFIGKIENSYLCEEKDTTDTSIYRLKNKKFGKKWSNKDNL